MPWRQLGSYLNLVTCDPGSEAHHSREDCQTYKNLKCPQNPTIHYTDQGDYTQSFKSNKDAQDAQSSATDTPQYTTPTKAIILRASNLIRTRRTLTVHRPIPQDTAIKINNIVIYRTRILNP